MTSAYTPGPWRIDPYGCDDSPAIVRVFPCGDSEPIAVPINSGFAELQLMSSAPDLLAALNRLIQSLPEDSNDYPDSASARQVFDSIRFAREAISKATGGAA